MVIIRENGTLSSFCNVAIYSVPSFVLYIVQDAFVPRSSFAAPASISSCVLVTVGRTISLSPSIFNPSSWSVDAIISFLLLIKRTLECSVGLTLSFKSFLKSGIQKSMATAPIGSLPPRCIIGLVTVIPAVFVDLNR